MTQPSAWRRLSGKQLRYSQEYHEKPRSEILPLLPDHAATVLDVGCGTGATSMLLRQYFPSARFLGLEVQAEARELAQRRLDAVSDHDLQINPLPEDFAAPRSVDLVLLLDVLEHMYHPWNALRNLHPCLAPGAQLIVSLPNARCLAFLEPIAAGSFPYAEHGLFDVTHIRFFTRRDAEAMLADTGYAVEDVMPVAYWSALMPKVIRRSWQQLETEHLVIKHGAVDGYNELFAGQWLMRAALAPDQGA